MTIEDLYQRTLEKRRYLWSFGYTYLQMWESDFDCAVESAEEMKSLIKNSWNDFLVRTQRCILWRARFLLDAPKLLPKILIFFKIIMISFNAASLPRSISICRSFPWKSILSCFLVSVELAWRNKFRHANTPMEKGPSLEPGSPMRWKKAIEKGYVVDNYLKCGISTAYHSTPLKQRKAEHSLTMWIPS